MRVLVTGAAGFIGRWVVADLLGLGHEVLAVDNLAQGDEANLAEFVGQPGFLGFERGDVRDEAACERWLVAVDAVAHLAASISVQDSIDDPGHDLRQRRRRHIPAARGGPPAGGRASCS